MVDVAGLRLVATFLAAGAAVGPAAGSTPPAFDERAFAAPGGPGHPSSARPAAFMMIPAGCTSAACTALAQFWGQVGTVPRFSGRVFRADCPTRGGGSPSCVQAVDAGQLRPDAPLFTFWDGRGWTPYGGKRDIEALGQAVMLVLDGAVDAADTADALASAMHDPAAARQRPRVRGQGQRVDEWDAAIAIAAATNDDDDDDDDDDDGGCLTHPYSRVRPDEALHLPVWSSFSSTRELQVAADHTVKVQEANISWPAPLNVSSKFAVLRSVVKREEVAAIHAAIRDADLEFNNEPDTVDSLPSHEIFVHEDASRPTDQELGGDDGRAGERTKLRTKLRAIMRPIEARITRIVEARYPEQCAGDDPARRCTSCFSLIRRYLPDERRGHGMHRDGQGLVTVVTSLSDYGVDYTGGLYVKAGGDRHALDLSRGDAVVHQSDLLHGVQVMDPRPSQHAGGEGGANASTKKQLHADRQSTRWSWIMWYKPSAVCASNNYEWSRACAEDGDPLCEYMYGFRLFMDPALSKDEKDRGRADWMARSAEHGLAEAMFKHARGGIPRALESRDFSDVAAWLRKSAGLGEADAAYQLAHLMLLGLVRSEDGSSGHWSSPQPPGASVLELLETAAAAGSSVFGGTRFAFFNLGVAALNGHAGRRRDPLEAAEWFLKSGLPEGIWAYAMFMRSRGEGDTAARFEARARRMGYGDVRRERSKQPLFELFNHWPPSVDRVDGCRKR